MDGKKGNFWCWWWDICKTLLCTHLCKNDLYPGTIKTDETNWSPGLLHPIKQRERFEVYFSSSIRLHQADTLIPTHCLTGICSSISKCQLNKEHFGLSFPEVAHLLFAEFLFETMNSVFLKFAAKAIWDVHHHHKDTASYLSACKNILFFWQNHTFFLQKHTAKSFCQKHTARSWKFSAIKFW